MTPFRATKGTVFEGGLGGPCIARWPGKIKPGSVENGIFSGLDWLPTLVAAAGNPNIVQQLLQGVQIGGQAYKNHLDGYNQMDLITGKGLSARHELFYFGESQLGAIRIDDFKFQFYQQPFGWPGREDDDGHADDRQPASGPIRANTVDPRSDSKRPRRRLYERLLCARILAVCSSAADRSSGGAIVHRVSADAAVRFLQPLRGQGEDRSDHEEPRRAINPPRMAGAVSCAPVVRSYRRGDRKFGALHMSPYGPKPTRLSCRRMSGVESKPDITAKPRNVA